MTNEQQQLTTLLLNLLPADHTTVGNSTLLEQFLAAAQAEGHQPPATEDDFKTAREALVAAGLAVKGKGRGGSTARATGAQRPDFALDTPPTPAPAAAATNQAVGCADQRVKPGDRTVLVSFKRATGRLVLTGDHTIALYACDGRQLLHRSLP